MKTFTGKLSRGTQTAKADAAHRMMAITLGTALLAASLIAGRTASAGEPIQPERPAGDSLSELTLGNLFSTGWNEDWVKRSRGDGTPDMSLLRVQTNFLVRLSRTDFFLEQNLSPGKTRNIDSLTETLEYAFNRRFLLAVGGFYQWNEPRAGQTEGGSAAFAFARVQLVDTKSSSLAFIFKTTFPNYDLKEKDTTLAFTLAGWQDLAPLGLGRTGLYYHVQGESGAGPYSPGAKRNDLTYDLSLAHTWTKPADFFGNASSFLEFWGRSELDGEHTGRTLLTVTPGVRATFWQRHILMAGVEFPISAYQPFERIYRLTYIYNF